ncbi:MAG TPA: SDR family oxidoreductase [Streptosporangiaceae bacterium]|jgi:NAD(P)-dependent dehydrogenase (short-subunit alcohol dehydrogenase family)
MSGNGPRVAVVTGASQGIGAGLVAGYRAQGWAVVANSVHIKPSDDPAVLTVAGDVSQPATADRIVTGALERFGRIDTLVNNAGVFIGKPFTDYTIDDYQLIVRVNLTGFFLVTQRVVAAMLKGGGGHIVNISTTMVEHANSSSPALLATLTKGGLVAATRSLAIEYASRGVRANAVSLGVIETPPNPPEAYAALAKLHPIGRVGQVSDVVAGILYLESAPFVTGEILYIDGGQSAGR